MSFFNSTGAARLFPIVSAAAVFAAPVLASATPNYVDVQDIPVKIGVSELVYAPLHHMLVLRDGVSTVEVIDLDTLATYRHGSKAQFTNLSLSPSQNVLFVADYGGENIGYGTPLNQSYVHRLNLATGKWSLAKAYIAGNVQAESDTKLLLKSDDQWISFGNDKFVAGGELQAFGTASGVTSVFEGDFRYDYRTHRLIHGNSGLSSQEIQAFRITAGNLSVAEGSGTYGSAQGYGGTVALANDGSAFYYGQLSVDALNVANNLQVFPEAIYAATGDVAFGQGTLYDAHSAAPVQSLGFTTSVYGLNPTGTDFWAYDASAKLLRHYVDQQAAR